MLMYNFNEEFIFSAISKKSLKTAIKIWRTRGTHQKMQDEPT